MSLPSAVQTLWSVLSSHFAMEVALSSSLSSSQKMIYSRGIPDGPRHSAVGVPSKVTLIRLKVNGVEVFNTYCNRLLDFEIKGVRGCIKQQRIAWGNE